MTLTEPNRRRKPRVDKAERGLQPQPGRDVGCARAHGRSVRRAGESSDGGSRELTKFWDSLNGVPAEGQPLTMIVEMAPLVPYRATVRRTKKAPPHARGSPTRIPDP